MEGFSFLLDLNIRFFLFEPLLSYIKEDHKIMCFFFLFIFLKFELQDLRYV